ncbi:ZIP family metal transporter [Halovenus marina]|uniref:ZIP family metal transporter n=1 Tax=Halovenus marina TaxID=3396621 RepID=UPI003F56343E
MAEETPKDENKTPNGGVNSQRKGLGRDIPRWVTALLPLVLFVVVLGVFMLTSPLAGIDGGEPLPDVTATHHTLPDDETVVVHITNNGPEQVTISQVLVDDAYWEFEIRGAGGDQTLAPRESARVVLPYHWNPGWDLDVALLLSDGAKVEHVIEAPQESPGFGTDVILTFALIGLFVGVIPVVIGMFWFPFIRGMSNRALHGVLLFAAGVLGFLAFDAGFESLELAERVPGAYEGKLLVVVGAVGALLLVQAISAWRDGRARDGDTRASSGLWIAYLVALSIGLHNFAEGLAIGSSFALGRVSLGAFLVIGFMLHNVTEGPAVVAPMANEARPKLRHFGALGVIAGAPVILGGWVGGLAYSPTVGAFFLALGVGAIVQVNWEIFGMVRSQSGRVTSATNLLAFLAGFAIMYVTDIFIVL